MIKDYWYLAVLFFLAVFLYSWFRKLLSRKVEEARQKLLNTKNEHLFLEGRNADLEKENMILRNSLEKNTALYDLTKEVCKPLNEEEVFSIFKEQIKRYVNLKDLKLIKGEADVSQFQDYTGLSLYIGKSLFGYLLASGVKDEDKDTFHILAHQFILGIKRAVLYEKVQELAIRDSLTHILSRRYFLERFVEEINRSRKFDYSLAFLMIDIDYFKDLNDRYGHLVGDVILKEVSRIIKDNIRQIDILGRYGGEEFCLALPETEKEEAKFAAERIREAIEDALIRAYDEDLRITLSVGIAVFPGDAQDTDALIDRADQALYKAKQSGRNKVCIHGG
ncbi:MAG: GGDEF domain-containing protein [Candidatus Omnitrophota bacterium]|nr:GGDEF domain-containing protein [Candidatus Omnitrophota bacterium]MBU2035196.1 GGDEF domain-containing protein [Candidatus Omnitrophota bacterium]MBU2221168.1 GGDEF domain-containing protein [Candidatus Omnitrophota bacterium]